MSEQRTFWSPFQRAFERFQISPFTNWSRFFNPQFYITYNSQDVDIENHVLERVGSYGKQLGRMIDVVGVLVSHQQTDALSPQERKTLDAFRDLAREVEAAKAEYQGPREEGVKLEDVDRLVEGLQSLARTDPAAYRVMAERLRAALGGEGQAQ